MIAKTIEIIFTNKLYKLLFFTLIAIIIFLFSHNNGMFWDNVLFASRLGNELYNGSIFNWYIPDSFDPGHPPFLGFLLAIAWKIFGHKLWVSHLVMLPFVIGLLYQLHLFASFYVKDKQLLFFAFVLLLADPTLSAQLVLVNPETISLFFFFLSINAILFDKYYLKIIALFFLSIVSFRSMMLASGVFLFEVSNIVYIQKRNFKALLQPKLLLSYVIGSIPGVSFVIWRLVTKGWLQTHPESPWAELWQFVTLKEFLRNIIVLAHRYADFGRIFILLFIIYSIYRYKDKLFSKEIKQLLLLAVTSVVVIIITSLLATNTMGHRYFISSFIAIAMLAFIIIQQYNTNKKLVYVILLAGLLTGNLWIYPRDIAQGWDASLAHLPYFGLRDKAISYMDEHDIKIEETATFFANATILDNVDLSGDMRRFESYNGRNNYIFYSNAYNMTDLQYQNIDTNYEIIKSFKKARIHIYIYKRKGLDK